MPMQTKVIELTPVRPPGRPPADFGITITSVFVESLVKNNYNETNKQKII
jgi:hypothetical protein